MSFLTGGGFGWTGTCGSIIACSAVVNMVTPMDDAKKIICEMFAWYEQTPFPSDIANQKAHNKQFPVDKYKSSDILVQTVAESPLCHVSVTRWCKAAGYASKSPERSERCARLTSDIVAYTATKLNSYFANAYKTEYSMSASAQGCTSCHESGKPFETGGWTRGKMQCNTCHDQEQDHAMK